MSRLAWIVGILVVVLALPVTVFAAQETTADDEGVIFRANGDITVGPEEVIGFVAVAEGEVTVDGTVTDTLMVFSGSAVVEGSVDGDIILFSGDVTLGENAEVNNITMFRGTLE